MLLPLYSACPLPDHLPGRGSQLSVPPPCPVTVQDPAYPSVAVAGVVADRSSASPAVSPARAPPRPPGTAPLPNRHPPLILPSSSATRPTSSSAT